MIGNAGVSTLLLILFVASPLGILFYMVWLSWTRGRDPEQDSMSVQYEPPDGLTPGECGTLLDNAAALRNITATITDLSVRGYLAIEPKGNKGSRGDHQDYIFHLTKPVSDWGGLKRHEREVLGGIFLPTNPLLMLSEAMLRLQSAAATAGNTTLSSLSSRVEAKANEVSEKCRALAGAEEGPRTSVAMSELPNLFSLHLTTIREAIYDGLVASGYYGQRPDRVRQVYAAKGIFLGFVMAVIGAVLAIATKTGPVPLILTGLVAGAIVFGFGWFLPARTSKGARTFAKLTGFREFLGRVEKDHIERLEKTPELFEKYLPYAMALGAETKWTQAFAGITVPRPQWYQGTPGGEFMRFVNDLNQMSNQERSANS
jgi:hypothetical protein